MPPLVTVAILAVLCLAVLLAMYAGWRRQARRTAVYVPQLPEVPPLGDPALGAQTTPPIDATYVSSTSAGDWLDRVVVHDLGVRSAATVQVFAGGVRIERTGAHDVFVPANAVVGARAAAGMAGKFVGRDGIVVLTWQAPGDGASVLDTGLRLRRGADREVLRGAVEALAADQPDTDQPSTTTKEHQ